MLPARAQIGERGKGVLRRTLLRAADPRLWIGASLAWPVLARPSRAQEHRVFEIDIRRRRVQPPGGVIRVEEGDRVELRIAADEDGELHLHGYDVVIELRAGEMSVAVFDAQVAGRFPVSSHGFGSSADREHGQEALFYLEVYPR